MARRPSGGESVASALKLAAEAETAHELRVALSMSLPNEFGLSLAQTAQILGRSVAWVAKRRSEYIAGVSPLEKGGSRTHGGRRNQVVSEEDEILVMEKACADYITMWRKWLGSEADRREVNWRHLSLNFSEHVRWALENYSGRPASIATAYNVMARVGRKRFPNYEPDLWRRYCDEFKFGGYYPHQKWDQD